MSTDILYSLRQSIKSKFEIGFVKGTEPHPTLAGCTHITVTPTLTVPRTAPTRWRRPEQANAPSSAPATDPTAEPDRFFSVDAIVLAWQARDGSVAEYLRQARDVARNVPLTERKNVVDWLDGKVKDTDHIAALIQGMLS